jgi:hypothetical protein
VVDHRRTGRGPRPRRVDRAQPSVPRDAAAGRRRSARREPSPGDDRHAQSRSCRRLRQRGPADADDRRLREGRPSLRADLRARAAHAAVARHADDGQLSAPNRRARQRHVQACRHVADARRRAEGRRLPDGCVHRRLRARRPLRAESRIRSLRRPHAGQLGGSRRRAAHGRTGARAGVRLDCRRQDAVVRLGAPLRSARAVCAARAVQVTLQHESVRRRDRLRGRGARKLHRPAAQCRGSCAHGSGLRIGPRRVARRARRAHARPVRLRRDPSRAARHLGAGGHSARHVPRHDAARRYRADPSRSAGSQRAAAG